MLKLNKHNLVTFIKVLFMTTGVLVLLDLFTPLYPTSSEYIDMGIGALVAVTVFVAAGYKYEFKEDEDASNRE